MKFYLHSRIAVPSYIDDISQTKCVIITTPFRWGSNIKLQVMLIKEIRGMLWGTEAKRYFKRFSRPLIFSFKMLDAKHQTHHIRPSKKIVVSLPHLPSFLAATSFFYYLLFLYKTFILSQLSIKITIIIHFYLCYCECFPVKKNCNACHCVTCHNMFVNDKLKCDSPLNCHTMLFITILSASAAAVISTWFVFQQLQDNLSKAPKVTIIFAQRAAS